MSHPTWLAPRFGTKRPHGRQPRRVRPTERRKVLLGLERLEDRTVPSITLSTGFAGLAFDFSQGATPPDTIAAAGPTEVGEAVNQTLNFYNKTGGLVVGGSFANFFSGVRVDAGDSTILTDPSLHYDIDSGRFVISLLDLDQTANKAYLDFAISVNNHPASGADFIAAQIDITETATSTSPNAGATLWTDFDRFGENASAYVFTFNMFTFPLGTQSLFDHTQILAIDKSAILSSTPSLTTHQIDLPGWNGSKIVNENVAPVDMHGATASDPMYFVEEANYGSATNNQLEVLSVANIMQASASNFQVSTVTVPSYTSNPLVDSAHPWNSGDQNANAPQLGTSDQMQTNDTRVLSAAWRRDSQGVEHLVATQEVGATLARGRWYEFITTPTSATLQQSGEMGAAGAASYFPSIDISPNGNIGVSYLESSSSEYMSMYVTGRTVSDPLNTLQPPVLAEAGQAGYTLSGLEPSPHRAGDFSNVSVDIDSSGNALNTFWAANEYTRSSADWGTWLSSFSVAPAAGPAGASVTASTPNGTLQGPVSSMTFTFSEAMNTGSFSLSSVDSFTGPNGSLLSQLTGFTWLDSTHLQVTFTAQSAAGAYNMTIGPNILRASDGAPMDQNGNGTPGEVPGDEYTGTFTISAPAGPTLIEGFEGSGTYNVLFPPATAQVSSAAAHDGNFGLIMHNGGDYIYRNDPAAIVQEGQTISAWVQFHTTADGSAYFLFGANSAVGASYALVLAAGSRKMYFQEVLFSFPLNSTIGTPVSQTYRANHWYRIEVAWRTDGSMTGRLYDSDGKTLLNTVNASATLITSGGIGFRGTGHDKYFDTVTVTNGTTPKIALALPTSGGQGDTIVLSGRSRGGDDGRHGASDAVFTSGHAEVGRLVSGTNANLDVWDVTDDSGGWSHDLGWPW
jgi:hypothetical protein